MKPVDVWVGGENNGFRAGAVEGLPVTVPEPAEYPVLLVRTVTVALVPGVKPLTLTVPVLPKDAVPAVLDAL